MKIGIDMDNTIITTIPVLKEYCKKYNDEVVKRNLSMNPHGFNTFTLYEWTEEEQMDFSNKYLEEAICSAKVKKDAVEIINKLRDENNYIYIITARKRPYFKDPYNLTKEYLDNHKILYNEIIVECEDKCKFCNDNKIDIMIDDEPHNMEIISKYIPVIALSGEQNEFCSGKNIIKVDNWKQVYNNIEEIYKNQI